MGYTAQGMKRDRALEIVGISKHQYYHRPAGNKKTGRPPSSHTLKDGLLVENRQVVEVIKVVKKDPDTDYGYRRMCYCLMLAGYLINRKKVYRLMDEADLLHKKQRPSDGKNYVKYRIVCPERPLHVLEMDIKMVWVSEHRRHAYILTILDTFTRMALYWCVGYQMTQYQVKQAWSQVIETYLQPHDLLAKELHVELRNDNGPQFSAHKIKAFLNENHIEQVFTHPYTPQENGHIESFHNILKTSLGKQPFWSLNELENRLEVFYEKYNHTRIHSGAAHLPPHIFWQCWEKNLIGRKVIANRKVRFNLTIPYQKLSGNESQREVLCSNEKSLDGADHLHIKEVNDATTSNNHRSNDHRRSSFASSKLNTNVIFTET